jgi:nitroreductase
MCEQQIIQGIFNRRSIRKFSVEPVSDEIIESILDAGRWAPSGLNNQPWRFTVIKNQSIKKLISECTKYSRIVNESTVCIAVFYNLTSGYNRDKDLLGIGACIQNMLLAAYSHNVGSVWLGEILNRKEEVNTILAIPEGNELMAVIAMGIPAEKPHSSRKGLASLILNRFD